MADSMASLAGRLGDARASLVPDDGRRRAAVAVVLYERAVLLMKRTERENDPWSGHVSLPGGRHEPDDPHLLATAIRETHEELGLELGEASVLGRLPTLQPLSAGPKGIEVTPFVFEAVQSPSVHTSAEAEAVFWLPLDDVIAGRLDSTFTHQESKTTFPAWRYGEFTIWGLTMRILHDLLERMQLSG
jgi:8-oxo-dGTP pyrophosphatase MutT (NUDIX family)